MTMDVTLLVLFTIMVASIAGWLTMLELRDRIHAKRLADLENAYIRVRDNFERVANLERHARGDGPLLSIEELDLQRAKADAIMAEGLKKPMRHLWRV